MLLPTDYDRIADRFASQIDERPWNALYERPVTYRFCQTSAAGTYWMRGAVMGGMRTGSPATEPASSRLDRSVRMVELAEQRLAGRGTAMQGDLRDLRPILADASVDLILSSLVLHYIDDLSATFSEWARVLRSGGRLVFSTHHPTHDQKSILEPGYLVEEVIEERWDWFEETMRYYRRPLSNITEPLALAGFVIERIVEPLPREALQKADPEGFEQLRRLPAFLFFRARKNSSVA